MLDCRRRVWGVVVVEPREVRIGVDHDSPDSGAQQGQGIHCGNGGGEADGDKERDRRRIPPRTGRWVCLDNWEGGLGRPQHGHCGNLLR